MRAESAIYDMAAFERQGLIATGGQDAVVRLWNPLIGRQVGALWGHTTSVMRVIADEDQFC